MPRQIRNIWKWNVRGSGTLDVERIGDDEASGNVTMGQELECQSSVTSRTANTQTSGYGNDDSRGEMWNWSFVWETDTRKTTEQGYTNGDC
jgi:hypothetical protein